MMRILQLLLTVLLLAFTAYGQASYAPPYQQPDTLPQRQDLLDQWPITSENAAALDQALQDLFAAIEATHREAIGMVSQMTLQQHQYQGAWLDSLELPTPLGRIQLERNNVQSWPVEGRQGRNTIVVSSAWGPLDKLLLLLAEETDDPDRYGLRAFHSIDGGLEHVYYGTGGRIAGYACWYQVEAGWRALEYTAYPNGRPHLLTAWENGTPAGTCVWDLDGTPTAAAGRRPLSGDPRLYPNLPPDTPPSGIPQDLPTPNALAACVVNAVFSPPEGPATSSDSTTPDTGQHPLPKTPCLALHLSADGATLSVRAPALPDAEFVGWSGAASGTENPITLNMNGDVVINAHYRIPVDFFDKALDSAIRDTLDLGQETMIYFHDLQQLTTLSAPGRDIEGVGGLAWCTRLKTLDLSRNRLKDISGLRAWPLLQQRVARSDRRDQDSPLNTLLAAYSLMLGCAIEELVLDENPIETFYFSEAPHLRRLSAKKTGLSFFPASDAMPLLEELYLDDTRLTGDLMLLPMLAHLRVLSVTGNQFGGIEWPRELPDRPGLMVDLRNNPLNERALCETIPALKANGIDVQTSDHCPLGDATADSDGDGYTDVEERRFVALFHADPDAREAAWQAALSDPKTPRWYLEALPAHLKMLNADALSVQAIPTYTMHIEIKGEGTLHPGPGDHEFARYALNREDNTWNRNPVVFTAEAAPGWKLVLEDDFSLRDALFDRTDTGARWRLDSQTYRSLLISFVNVGEFQSLDLVADLELFLQQFFPELEAAVFDVNDLKYMAPGERLPQGRCAWQYRAAAESWRANLLQAGEVLGDFGKAHPEIVRLLAAYGSFGLHSPWGFLIMLRKSAEDLPEIQELQMESARNLEPSSQLDCNRDSNQEIWEQVSYGRKPSVELFSVFAEAAAPKANE
jgi:hypothetical protein